MKEVSKDPPVPLRPVLPTRQASDPTEPSAEGAPSPLRRAGAMPTLRGSCAASLLRASEMLCARARCHVPVSRNANGLVLVAHQCASFDTWMRMRRYVPEEKSSSNRRPRGGGRNAWRPPQELEESERHGEMAGASHVAGDDRSAGPRRFPTGGGFEAPSRATLVWRRTGSSHCRRVRSRPTARALGPDHADGSHAEGNGSRAQLGRPPSRTRSTPIVRILLRIERCAASLGITLLPPHAVHRPRRGALTVRHP